MCGIFPEHNDEAGVLAFALEGWEHEVGMVPVWRPASMLITVVNNGAQEMTTFVSGAELDARRTV